MAKRSIEIIERPAAIWKYIKVRPFFQDRAAMIKNYQAKIKGRNSANGFSDKEKMVINTLLQKLIDELKLK